MTMSVTQHGDGPDIVCLHGWGLHGGVWTCLGDAWLPGCRRHIIDLPGHGRNRREPLGGSLPAIAAKILSAAPPRAIWLGWSLGGMLALTIARLAPERVEKLILVGTSPRFVQAPDWPHAVPLSTLAQFAEDLAADYSHTLVRFLSLQAGKAGLDRAVLRQLRKFAREYPSPATQALQTGLAVLQQSDLRPELGEIRQPVLMVHGRWDKLVPLAAADYLATQLANARLVAVDQAGHAPFLSHPDRFQQAATAFIKGGD